MDIIRRTKLGELKELPKEITAAKTLSEDELKHLTCTSKDSINTTQLQVAINDWGHLTVRLLNSSDGSDVLVVFDATESERIISFCGQIAEVKPHRKEF